MSKETLYWIISLVSFFYLIIENRKNFTFILVILFFFEGIFTYFGQLTWDLYKITLLLFGLYVFINKSDHFQLDKKNRIVLLVFLVFSILFGTSALINDSKILLFLNQFSRYLLPLLALFLIQIHVKINDNYEAIDKLVKQILDFQIGLSVINFILLGFHENIVGSISSNGGAAATLITLLGIVFIWFRCKGKLSRKDWIYIGLLMIIGIVSMKRAIWIVVPIFLFLLSYYVYKNRNLKRLFIIIPLLPAIFYLGVKINPTFNKERKVWGSFDFNYFYNYAKNYSVGEGDDENVVVGRVGATIYVLDHIFDSDESKSWIGYGLNEIYGSQIETEQANKAIQIESLNSITMATGLFQNYYSGGILGIIFFLLYIGVLLFTIKSKRKRNLLIILFIWEYAFYTNSLIRIPAVSFLFFYLINYSDSELFLKNDKTKVTNSLS